MKTITKMSIVVMLILIQVSVFPQGARRIAAVDYGNNSKAGKYAPIRGINMYYEVYGQGEPMLLIHGNGTSIRAFRYQIPYFAQHYKVIAVDSRAQGKSLDSNATLNYEMMAEDFNELLNYLKIDSAYVIGWSDGGINGLLLAINHPEKVKKLVITGANLVPDAITSEGSNMIARELAKLRTSKQNAATKNTTKLLHMMEVEPNIPMTDLQKIKCPVLVVAGDNDVIKPSHTLQIFENIHQAYLWILPQSGHGTIHRYKDEFNAKAQYFFTHPYSKPNWIDWEE